MATEPESWSSLGIAGGRPAGRPSAKPKKTHNDMYLCVALVALLAWALFVALGW
ncbi:MAG TPA: hypothetical protein VFJ52_03415 [Terriglobia bacterium]|nr:hypothetical protein [Terriglobia bacterium]